MNASFSAFFYLMRKLCHKIVSYINEDKKKKKPKEYI